MFKAYILIFSIIMSQVVVANDKTSINFAPLPTKKTVKNAEDFLSMATYLKNKLSLDFNFIYKQDYQDILDGFENKTIDIAYLGPLPLISLVKKYQHIEPIVTFKNNSGSSKYRCVLAKFKKDDFNNNKPIKVALTQPLSTCGYLMTSQLLKDNFNVDLKQQQYHYTMSHTNALLAVLQGDYLIAGAKKNIAEKFKSLGIEIIAQSKELPGFSLVANKKTLSPKQIQTIQQSLLSVSPDTLKLWSGFTSNGMKRVSLKDYDVLNINIVIPQSGNIK
ncbi:MAG: PhnD/SsuA/transferrin family substrate-binding protein [Gammaproteobacteria bacterium]|nr:PhnD/SsuA/transferrin family substrate-binding protein [Gammaproteobacteria bacterium]